MSFVCHSYVFVNHLCVLVYHSYVIVCTHMPYDVTRGYSYLIRMTLICTRMSSVCHSYVPVCHLYVSRIWFYHEPCLNAFIQKSVFYIIAILVKEVFFLSSLKKHRQLSTKYTQNMYCNMG